MVTFDCYGTLVDWEAGIAAAFVREARARTKSRSTGRDRRALTIEVEPEVEAEALPPLSGGAARDGPARRRTGSAGRSPEERAVFLAESLCPTGARFPTRTRRSRSGGGGLPARHPLERGRRPARRGRPLRLPSSWSSPRSRCAPTSRRTATSSRLAAASATALAPRRAELVPRRGARERARHPGRVDQPEEERRAAKAEPEVEVATSPDSRTGSSPETDQETRAGAEAAEISRRTRRRSVTSIP